LKKILNSKEFFLILLNSAITAAEVSFSERFYEERDLEEIHACNGPV
jgi:hypothetical protein